VIHDLPSILLNYEVMVERRNLELER
jgi:hypothetical protein